MYWEHLGHFNRAISHLKWHKIVCMRYLAWNPLTCFPCICNLESPDISYGDLLRVEHKTSLFITRVSEVIMFSPCMFVCLCVCVYVCHDVCPDHLTMKDWCHTNNILQVHCWGCLVVQVMFHALMTSLMTSQDHKIGQILKLIYLRQYLS